MTIKEIYLSKVRKNCVFIPRFIFVCVGLNFGKDLGFFYNCYSKFMIVLGYLYPWATLHLVLHNLDNFDTVMNALFSLFGGCAESLKLTTLLVKRKKLQVLLDKLEDMQEKYNTEDWGKNYVLSFNKKSTGFTMMFYTFLLFIYTTFMIARLTNPNSQEWKTPIVDVSVINTTYSPNYEVAFFFQCFAAYMASSVYCVINVLIVAILVDLTVQFKILRIKFLKTFRNVGEKNYSNYSFNQDLDHSWPILQQHIITFVQEHLYLIKLANDVEDICSMLIFYDVVGNLLMICFAGYYATTLPLFDIKAIQSYFEIIMIITTLFLVCYYGTILSLSSKSIADACFEINFIGSDIRFQKYLLLIMARSQKPVRLTAGGFAELSMVIFVWIIRTSYSAFMLLRKDKNN